MIRSAKMLPSGAELHAEVVIVGAGPLGIVTALEVGDAGHDVLLVESGNQRYSSPAQRLSDPAREPSDVWHVQKDLAVRRQIGGASVMWGGRCLPFDEIDYEPRPVLPEHLWPVTADDVVPYLGRACAWSQCGRPIFRAEELPELAARQMIPGFVDGDVETRHLERWALPTRFGRLYRDRLAKHPRVTVMTDLTCNHIACDPANGRVERLRLVNAEGTAASARGRFYVLAAGGIEGTRLLMASDDVHRDGIGNSSGHLGHWYMAHVEARIAELRLRTPPGEIIYNHERDRDGVYVRRRFTFSPALQSRKALPNCAIWLVNPSMGDPAHGSGILSGVYLTLISPVGRFLLAEAIRRKGTNTDGGLQVKRHLRNIVRDLAPATRFALGFTYARFLRRGRKAPGFFVRSAANIYPLDYHGEHLPHRDSRLVLTEDRDASGLRRARTEMFFSDADVQSVARSMHELDQGLRAAGVGELRYLYDDLEGAVREQLKGSVGYHQTGTTRMAADPSGGVVDKNLAVFDAENLFVASTSVFPTSSQANPTLTGIAFCVRLAEHLRSLLSAAPASVGGSAGSSGV